MAIYLDYNATAPVRPEAVEKMREVLSRPANASSVHGFGRAARKHVEDARKIISDAVSAFPDEVIFTGSGTESNATALNGFPGRRIVVSAVEHSSVLKAHDDAVKIPVTPEGVIVLEALEKTLAADERPALVSVMLANNETGVIQPVAEVAALCKKYGALFHCDAVQALGKMPVDFGAVGCDLMTVAAHKAGGPVGAAALIVRRKLPFQPLLKGGGQEMNRRAGTQNAAAIAAFGVAALKVADVSHMQNLRLWLDAMEKEIETGGGVVFGKAAPRLPNTSSIAMPGVGSEVQLIDLDLKGFAVSGGSACTSGKSTGSHVLTAMGAAPETAGCAIRVSGGWQTTEAEIQSFTKEWKDIGRRLLQKAG